MLLPALQRSRSEAVITACANKQRQLGGIYQLYADDWDGWFAWSDGRRSPAANWGTLPIGRQLTSYGVTPLVPNSDINANASNWYICPGELRNQGAWLWNTGYHVVVGWPGGQFSSTWPELNNRLNTACPATDPFLSATHCTIRRAPDLGDERVDQAFINCATENFDCGFSSLCPIPVPKKYGCHDLTDWGVYRGNVTWSDLHTTRYRSTDGDHLLRTYNGSFHGFW